MQHCLARHAALEAAKAKTHALGTLHAAATAFGARDAHHGLNSFLADMDFLIARASGAATADAGPSAGELAFFERVEREALANRDQTARTTGGS